MVGVQSYTGRRSELVVITWAQEALARGEVLVVGKGLGALRKRVLRVLSALSCAFCKPSDSRFLLVSGNRQEVANVGPIDPYNRESPGRNT